MDYFPERFFILQKHSPQDSFQYLAPRQCLEKRAGFNQLFSITNMFKDILV